MSFAGVPIKQPFQVLRSSDWNTLVNAVDQVYILAFYTNQALTTGTADIYVGALYTASDAVINGDLIVAGELVGTDSADFYHEIYVKGLKVLHDQDPINISQFLSDAYGQIYDLVTQPLNQLNATQSNVQQLLSNVNNVIQQSQQVLNTIDNYVMQLYTIALSTMQDVHAVKVYFTPSALESFILPVTTTAVPLTSTSTPIRRALLFVTTDTTYVVYVGGATGQHFPIPPGSQLSLDACDALQIYLRSENYSYVRILLETLNTPVC